MGLIFLSASASAGPIDLDDMTAKCSGSGCGSSSAEIGDYDFGLTFDGPSPGDFAGAVLTSGTSDAWAPLVAPPLPWAGGLLQLQPVAGRLTIGGTGLLGQADDVRPAAVPEPPTLALFGLGLAIMARYARRSRRR